MDVMMPKPGWPDEEDFVPTPGGVLDGLSKADGGSSLHLLMDPKDIADIDQVPTTVSDSDALIKSVPMPFVPVEEKIPNTPPGVSVDENMRRAQRAQGALSGSMLPTDPAYGLMTDWFWPGHEMDYKQQGQYRDFGNFNYGAVGSELGLTPYTLHSAAGAVQMLQKHWVPDYGVPFIVPPFGDNQQDYDKIEEGIQYRRSHKPK